MKLAAMSAETFRAWYIAKQAGKPGSTQPDKAYRLARTMLNQAVDDGVLPSNPCRVKGAGREHAPERPVAMPDQVALLAGAIDQRYQPMVLLAAYGSLRFGELAGLRRLRVDLLHRTIRIEEQGVERRSRSGVDPQFTQGLSRTEAFKLGLGTRQQLIEKGVEGFRRAVLIGVRDHNDRTGRHVDRVTRHLEMLPLVVDAGSPPVLDRTFVRSVSEGGRTQNPTGGCLPGPRPKPALCGN